MQPILFGTPINSFIINKVDNEGKLQTDIEQ